MNRASPERPLGSPLRRRVRGARHALVLAIAFGLCACGPQLVHYRGYAGDGTFVAHVASSPLCRDGYTVDLGAVDLTRPDAHTLRLEGLPAIEATIGIALSANSADVPRAAALVELTLRDGEGRIVLSRHERLADWIRSFASDLPSRAYLYQRGTQIEVAVAPGAVRVERFPLGPDGSWGTYFTPRRGARYTLHFAVEDPDAGLAGVETRLQVNSVVGCP